jgi:hypothetical protein
VGFLKLGLASDATHCNRVSKQSLETDVATAFDATIDNSLCEPFARDLDLVQLLQAAIDMLVVELSQYIRYRLISCIVHHAGEIDVSLIARLQERSADVSAQLVIERIKQFRQLSILCWCKFIHINTTPVYD